MFFPIVGIFDFNVLNILTILPGIDAILLGIDFIEPTTALTKLFIKFLNPVQLLYNNLKAPANGLTNINNNDFQLSFINPYTDVTHQ